MKNQKRSSLSDAARARKRLFSAILSLKNERECEEFFTDLCTPSELESIIDRWAVVGYLNEGIPYRKIHELTGVSVTTIGRVARFLTAGHGGYSTALKRLSTR